MFDLVKVAYEHFLHIQSDYFTVILFQAITMFDVTVLSASIFGFFMQQ